MDFLEKCKADMDKAFANAAKRAEQVKADSPEPVPIEKQIEVAKRQIEATLNARQYDRAGIETRYWDFIIQLAAERLVKASLGGKTSVGRVTDDSVGFILMGKPRCGKTFLMRILADLKAIPAPIGEAVIKNDYQAEGLDRLFSAYPALRSKDFTFDDLGIVNDAKSYGNAGTIKNILFERYEHWQGRGNCATFISSNNEGYEQLKNAYGEQIANRIADMCVIIPVSGGNRGESAARRYIYSQEISNRKENQNNA